MPVLHSQFPTGSTCSRQHAPSSPPAWLLLSSQASCICLSPPLESSFYSHFSTDTAFLMDTNTLLPNPVGKFQGSSFSPYFHSFIIPLIFTAWLICGELDAGVGAWNILGLSLKGGSSRGFAYGLDTGVRKRENQGGHRLGSELHARMELPLSSMGWVSGSREQEIMFGLGCDRSGGQPAPHSLFGCRMPCLSPQCSFSAALLAPPDPFLETLLFLPGNLTHLLNLFHFPPSIPNPRVSKCLQGQTGTI